MKTSSIPALRQHRSRPDGGFTLVELMIALLLSLLLAVAILKMQTKMASQSVRISDTGTRDTQARAAMDLITRDLTGAGFLPGNLQFYCDAVVTYNSAGGGSYFAHHPVDAVSAVSGTTMTFAPSLTLNYPGPTAAGVTSDVLVALGSTGSTQFNDTTNPWVTVAASGTPLSTGTVWLNGTGNLAASHTVIVQVPILGTLACMRAPLSKVTTAKSMESAASATMPSTFYNGFVNPVAKAGFPAALTNAGMFASSRVIDIGTLATSTQVFTAYYIDGATNPYPVLMRAQYSLIDDSVVTAPQPIAAGVVALRVSFGVDPTSSGAVTAYEESAAVTTNKHWSYVRSVRVALVTRTINDDPNADGSATSAPTSIVIGPSTSATSVWFPALTVPSSKHRYIVNTTEVAYRNWLWKN